jgi:hypothetical protein
MHATFRFLIASLAVAAAPRGAPLICFPIDAASASSLPWNEHGAAVAPLASSKLPAELRKAVGASDDALLHMEALRRAALFAEQSEAKQDPWDALVGSLEKAALAAAARPDGATEPERRAAIAARSFAWFDLGYALSIGRRLGREHDGDAAAFLRKAIELRPDDRSLRFGAALAFFDAAFDEDPRQPDPLLQESYANLARALDGADERLRRIALTTFGRFLGCESDAALLEKVRSKLASKA